MESPAAVFTNRTKWTGFVISLKIETQQELERKSGSGKAGGLRSHDGRVAQPYMVDIEEPSVGIKVEAL